MIIRPGVSTIMNVFTGINKLKTSESVMRIREKFYLNNTYALATPAHFAQAMKRFNESKNLKNPSQIKREIQLCKKYWKCYPYHYFIYNLFSAENQVTDEQLINYIPQFYWFKLFLPHFSSHRFSIIGENKIILAHFFRALTIAQPKTLCNLMNRTFYTRGMDPLLVRSDLG